MIVASLFLSFDCAASLLQLRSNTGTKATTQRDLAPEITKTADGLTAVTLSGQGMLCGESGMQGVKEEDCEAACKSRSDLRKYKAGSWSHSPGCFWVGGGKWKNGCHWNQNTAHISMKHHNMEVCYADSSAEKDQTIEKHDVSIVNEPVLAVDTSAYGEVIRTEWCTDNEDFMNTCDGSLAVCWNAGFAKCNMEGDSCHGVMVHDSWTPRWKGFKLCRSDKMTPKGDWMVRLKKSAAPPAPPPAPPPVENSVLPQALPDKVKLFGWMSPECQKHLPDPGLSTKDILEVQDVCNSVAVSEQVTNYCLCYVGKGHMCYAHCQPYLGHSDFMRTKWMECMADCFPSPSCTDMCQSAGPVCKQNCLLRYAKVVEPFREMFATR